MKDDYLTLSQLEIIPGRFVNYFDFTAYDISSHGLTLSEIEMNNDEVFSRIYLPDPGPLMTNNKLQPISQLIGRILTYNIYLKTGSYNYYSHDLATCVHVITAGLEVNWAKILFDTMVKKHSTFLPYGAFLTLLTLKKDKILTGPNNV